MKTFGSQLLRVIALAAAIGFAPAALAQAAPAPGPAAPEQSQTAAAPATNSANVAVPAVNAATPEPAANQAAPAVTPAAALPVRAPEPGIGQPDGRMGLQDQFTSIGQGAATFHDWILMPAILIITLIVLALMIYVVIRYRRAAHPVPSRTTHNTMVEVIWTLVPVLILVVIAVPSIQLLSRQYSPPPADLTVKVIGNQWYWTYQYPDNGVEVTSNMLKEGDDATRQANERPRTDTDGPRLLAVDERLVVPRGAVVKLIVTSADVIHDFAVPAFWVKMDAVPGRLNETWFRADREGVFFGQCSELCGARHGFMPIAIEVVSPEAFRAYIVAKGGHLPGTAAAAAAPANPDSTQASQVPAAANQARSDAGEPLTPTNQVQATGNAALVRERAPQPAR